MAKKGKGHLFSIDPDLSEPFRHASRYYHELSDEDKYGEEMMKKLAAGRKCFFVRKSNSEPATCVTVTRRDEDGKTNHTKARQMQGEVGAEFKWHFPYDEHGEPVEQSETNLDTLLDRCLGPRGYTGLEKAEVGLLT
eukprot:CAMPEP_0184318794 /NCGR_PEP_ID=MMETSP1049-20130417/104879_1 /TAXON_ID=77928 /ORGANISM="Proteomonas sulcata, Strain CCMP704" /LENGTH=136 /DNA_ID=CAMNT_0026638691 /DNA_START=27 /DNA_END=437 /DNA_ORIENTATION=+